MHSRIIGVPPESILLEQKSEPNQEDSKAEQSSENEQLSSPNEENSNQSTERHQHTEECYILLTECTHQHTAECYPSGDTSAEPDECTHLCTEQSSCIQKILDCPYHEENEQNEGSQPPDIPDENQDENAQIDFEGHKHTEDCYISFTECTHQHTEECYPSGDTSAEPTECTHLCTEQSCCITKVLDCPYHEENEQNCICTEICTEKSVNPDCPVCQNDRTLCKAMAALVTNPVAQIGDTSYDDLKSAVEAAQDKDRIILLADTTVTETISIDKNLTLDLQGHTVTVQIPSTDTTKSAFTVSSPGHFSIVSDKDKGTLTSDSSFDNRAVEGTRGSTVILNNIKFTGFHAKNGNGAAVCITNGSLTVNNCSLENNLALNGGAIYSYESDTYLTGNNFLSNQSDIPTDSSEHSNSGDTGGGAVYIDNRSNGNAKTDISNNIFSNNSTTEHGGSLYLAYIYDGVVSNNTIESSTATSHTITSDSGNPKACGGDGGGIRVHMTKRTLTIQNNTIKDCIADGMGGGIRIISNAGGTTVLNENNIIHNTAKKRGGGMSLVILNTGGFVMKSGNISQNHAEEYGGGIDYTTHSWIPLELTNVLITENRAVRGAGIWACPVSITESNSTLGGAVFGNTATGTWSATDKDGKVYSLEASGDEVRYEGLQSPDEWVNDTQSHDTTMTVMKRALGGGLMQWYQDEAEHRYTSGDPQADLEIYTDTQKSFGLHGELSAEHQTLAQSEAQLIIQGNTTNGRGGGIASNAPIYIGIKDADVSVMVEKVWTENNHPQEIKVDLYRIGADGERVKLDSDVVLNEANSWKAEFHDLPSKYVDINGKVQDCTYEVEEQPIDGWEGSSSIKQEGNTYYITLTNKPSDKPSKPDPEQPDKPEKPDPDEPDRPSRPDPDKPSRPDPEQPEKPENPKENRPSVPDEEENIPEQKPQQGNRTEQQKPIPETGDNNFTAICLGLLAISSVGMIAAMPKRKK